MGIDGKQNQAILKVVIGAQNVGVSNPEISKEVISRKCTNSPLSVVAGVYQVNILVQQQSSHGSV